MFKPGPNIYGLINTLLLYVQLIIHYYSYRNNHVHVQTAGSLPMSIGPLTAPFLVVAAFSTISTVAYIENVTEAPDSFFSGQDGKWIQAYIFWGSSSHILLAWGQFLLVFVNEFARGWLALDSCPLGKQENLLVPDYWTGLFSNHYGGQSLGPWVCVHVVDN